VVLQPVDPNLHYKERRRKARRRRRAQRLAVLTVAVAATGGTLAFLAIARSEGARLEKAAVTAKAPAGAAKQAKLAPRPAPIEMRGVHVTMALASIPGKVEEYLGLDGLNTLQLDIKDENGEVGFVPSAVPLAKQIGAARSYYKPRQVVALTRKHGVYLVGRIVAFEDPILSVARPELAVQRADGSPWTNHAGLGWTDPYNREVWKYLGDLAVASARLGFDEIQFDYVRFPTDGDIEDMRFPARTETPMGWTIAEFVHYASKRLKPLGVRVSADVFGLSATRDLGIGQVPRRISRYLDAIYPMVYPSHYGSGEYNLENPNAAPGPTVAYSLRDFNEQLAAIKGVRIIPWLQDFSLGRPYTLTDIQEQIDSARRAKAGGYLLWNAAGVYTPGALEPARWSSN
jgi:hypothetical protein